MGSEISKEKTEDRILKLLETQKNLSAKELSDIIGISDRAIEKQIAKLKDQGILKRIGPDNGGYWLIIKK